MERDFLGAIGKDEEQRRHAEERKESDYFGAGGGAAAAAMDWSFASRAALMSFRPPPCTALTVASHRMF